MPATLPPLNALRVFECAARHLSFTQAAEELSITQSAVSHQVKGLEGWLGFALFERHGQRLSLTPGGKIYAAALGTAIAKIVQATQDVMTTGSHQVLNLRGYGTFFVRWLIPKISDFQEKNRDIKIRLTTHVEAVDFTRDNVDLGIVYGIGPWERCRSDVLFTDALIPVVSAKLAAKLGPSCSLEDMLSLPMLHSRMRDQWEDWLRAAGATRKPSENDIYFEDVTILYQCVLEGLGVALVQIKYVERDLAEGRLVAPYPFTLARRGGYHLVCPVETVNDDKIVRFRDWLLAQNLQSAPVVPSLAQEPARIEG
jgi:LysR family transcriptional regulator, glycine cleavage system transcriptional activator